MHKNKHSYGKLNKALRKEKKLWLNDEGRYNYKKDEKKRRELVYETRLQFKVKWDGFLKKHNLKQRGYKHCQRFHTHRKYEKKVALFNNTF